MAIIKERCAEESEMFVNSIIDLMPENNRDSQTLRDKAARRLRDLSKCILKQ